MHIQTSGQWALAVAILVAAVMVCGTLLTLNLRTTVPVERVGTDANYLRLIYSGCVRSADTITLSCPIWVQP